MKKTTKLTLIFLFTFVLLNGALLQRPVQKFLLDFNRLDYFYTAHDWVLKLIALNSLEKPAPAVAIGTSRTVLLLDPRILSSEKENFRNLGLIAASYGQIQQVAKKMAASGIRFPVVYVEVNPIALSARFSESTEKADYNSVFTSPDPLLSSELGRFLLAEIPVLRYRAVLADTAHQALTYTAPVPEEIAQSKRAYHFRQFKAVDRPELLGFVPSPLVRNEKLRSHLMDSCVSASNWAISKYDPEKGLEKLSAIIEELKPVAEAIILWIPPSSPDWQNPQIGVTRERVMKEISGWGLPVIDLSAEKAQKDWFNDCIHASSDGAAYYSRRLKEEQERLR